MKHFKTNTCLFEKAIEAIPSKAYERRPNISSIHEDDLAFRALKRLACRNPLDAFPFGVCAWEIVASIGSGASGEA